MTEPAPLSALSSLERLDLSLAARMANKVDPADVADPENLAKGMASLDESQAAQFIAAALMVRGILIPREDVQSLLQGRPSRFQLGHQEHALVVGMSRVLAAVRERATQGRAPDGWMLVDQFRILTRDLARFRNNELRRDQPWDGHVHLVYPESGQLRQILDTFDVEHRYRDLPVIFDRMHPVRQSCRVFWRFARIAPFPDFNVPMALVAMAGFLLAAGYPLYVPHAEDRGMLNRLVAGPPPIKVPWLERRLAEALAV